MQGNWIKVVLFVLLAFMLAGITQVLLDPGLGKPDESRRVKHPAGFSAIPPRKWGGSIYYGSPKNPDELLRISPDRSTGRQPSLGIVHVHTPKPPEELATATQITFQNQPAYKIITKTRNSWTWGIDFQRGSEWYHIGVTYPVETEVENSAIWPFVESFRVEPVLNLSAATVPPPGTSPSTSPATLPTPAR